MPKYSPGDVTYSVAEVFEISPSSSKTKTFVYMLSKKAGTPVTQWNSDQCKAAVEWLHTIKLLGYENALISLREGWSKPTIPEVRGKVIPLPTACSNPIRLPKRVRFTLEGICNFLKLTGPSTTAEVAEFFERSDSYTFSMLNKCKRRSMLIHRGGFWFIGSVGMWKGVPSDCGKVWGRLLREEPHTVASLALSTGFKQPRIEKACKCLVNFGWVVLDESENKHVSLTEAGEIEAIGGVENTSKDEGKCLEECGGER